jgi:hypothetical protein
LIGNYNESMLANEPMIENVLIQDYYSNIQDLKVEFSADHLIHLNPLIKIRRTSIIFK